MWCEFVRCKRSCQFARVQNSSSVHVMRTRLNTCIILLVSFHLALCRFHCADKCRCCTRFVWLLAMCICNSQKLHFVSFFAKIPDKTLTFLIALLIMINIGNIPLTLEMIYACVREFTASLHFVSRILAGFSSYFVDDRAWFSQRRIQHSCLHESERQSTCLWRVE